MSKFIGRIIKLGIGKETTRGIPVNPSFWLPIDDISFSDKIGIANYGELYCNQNGLGSLNYTIDKEANGQFSGSIDADSFGLFLLSIFGTISSAGPTDSAYTHTFSFQADNVHDSLTIVEDNPIGSFRYPLAVLDEFNIFIRANDLVKFTANFVAKPSETISTPSVTYTSQILFRSNECTIEIKNTLGALDGTSLTKVKLLNLNFKKSPIAVFHFGSVTPKNFLNRMYEISGSFDLDYSDNTFHDYLVNSTNKVMRIKFKSSTLIGSSSVYQFVIDFSKILFDSWEVDKSNDRIAIESINFKALYNSSVGNTVNSCQLINKTSSY